MHSRQAIKFVNCIKKGAGAMLQRETPFFGAQGLCTFPVRTYITQAANFAKFGNSSYPAADFYKYLEESPARIDVNDIIDFVYCMRIKEGVTKEAVIQAENKAIKDIDQVKPEELATLVEFFSAFEKPQTQNFWEIFEAKCIDMLSQRLLNPEDVARVIQAFGSQNLGSEVFWRRVSKYALSSPNLLNSNFVRSVFVYFKDEERSRNSNLWELLVETLKSSLPDYTPSQMADIAISFCRYKIDEPTIIESMEPYLAHEIMNGSTEQLINLATNLGNSQSGGKMFWKSVYQRVEQESQALEPEFRSNVTQWCQEAGVINKKTTKSLSQ